MIASVVVDVLTEYANRPFDYLVPENLVSWIEKGERVYVPFGKKNILGFVVDLKSDDEAEVELDKLKSIYSILDLEPCLNSEQLYLAERMHRYYFCLYIQALYTMIPPALKVKYTEIFLLKDKTSLDPQLLSLFKDDKLEYDKSLEAYLPKLKKAVKEGYLELTNSIETKDKVKTVTMLRRVEKAYVGKENHKRVYNYLTKPLEKREVISSLEVSPSVIATMVKNGYLEEYQEEINRFDYNHNYTDKSVKLNDEQIRVYEEIKQTYNSFKTHLLFGVTGSGKTEIYLKIIEDMISLDKTAILLVPEISLTPQIVARFKGRFGSKVACLHSGLSLGEKYDEWRNIKSGNVKVVVGARSAIFAPLENIGCIIIDESHEASYKQDTNPRYDAVMIARIRANHHNAICILGSATPKIEDYYKAQNGLYNLIELKKRANDKPLPICRVVNMTEELKKGNRSILSLELQKNIKDRLDKKEQSILLLNRRGFSTFVMCRGCGEVIKCPNCSVSLTFHQVSNSLKCHYCGYERENQKVCPTCNSDKVRFMGGGTEKIVEEINKLFPTAKVLRMDMDNTKTKDSHERIINAFNNGEADILVGTQMVAKGLDFPKCSLVGIVNADVSLKFPEYDSMALGFDLLVQVSGRAGRHDTDGLVLIQSYDTDNYVIKYAKNQDYEAFYKEELTYRNLGGYPPFSKMVEIILSGKDYDLSFEELTHIAIELRKNNSLRVLGPCEDFISKLNNEYRFKLTIKFKKDSDIDEILNDIYLRYEMNSKFKLIINRR